MEYVCLGLGVLLVLLVRAAVKPHKGSKKMSDTISDAIKIENYFSELKETSVHIIYGPGEDDYERGKLIAYTRQVVLIDDTVIFLGPGVVISPDVFAKKP